ncbi:MAG TPA: hypothetical protein VKP65_21950 [Rhodothermales bacterium]|nr:hypothetical protein [Rhodothermales bacterium]
MKTFSDLFPHSLWAVLVIALLASGCRTYGNYNNEEKTLDEIRRSNTLFEAEYEKAQGNLNTLTAAADANERLAPFATSYEAVVDVHEAVLQQHQILAEEAESNDGDYRLLNRTYGAIISDQQVVRDRYEALLADMQHAVDSTAGFTILEESRFQIAPQFYDRIAHANAQRSLTDIMAMARTGTPAPLPVETPEASTPDTTAAN